MCGIVGIVGKQVQRYQPLISKMILSIKYRGPDGRGEYYFSNCALGHVRLSIIDIKNGAQPMVNNKLGIVFNGEIYGYKDIKRQLTDYFFKTGTDTELILALYQKYGYEMLNKLPGMFAFALWDDNRQSLFCARDRFGEKPLYYAIGDNGEFIFGSEIKAILSTGLIKPKLNYEQIGQFLNYQYICPQKTIYTNIYVLPPACSLLYKDGQIKIKKYWRLPTKINSISEEDAVEEFRRLFRQAIKRQLIADVPVGAFLSGGLDSGTVVSVASEFVKNLTTISFGFKNGVSELKLAKSMADRYHSNHIEISDIDYNIADMLLKMQKIYDEPMADPASIPAYLIAQHARKYVKVVLTGDAGDELLGGYDLRYRTLAYMEKFHKSNISLDVYNNFLKGQIFLLRLCRKIRSLLGKDKTQLMLSGTALRDAYIKMLAISWTKKYPENILSFIHNNAKMFTDKTLYSLGIQSSNEYYNMQSEFLENDRLDNALRLDILEYLPGNGLVKTDRTTMACGLESRTPFLDIDLAEFCISLPFNLKLRGKEEKYILKKSFSNKWTSEIKNNIKNGFSPPMGRWMQNKDFITLKNDYLGDKNRKIYSILSYDIVQKIIDVNNLNEVWNLLNLSMWFETHEFNL
ncbi:asparagine synthase (glutamine-hydrolyzing) [Pectinatus frisingensis]|uniref:asparagine synthase (glutamine-hydrolyzing) n=1 Tax=Pectinatus frisingensis TaxID=865 RepID=UPI0018C52E7B|nr:asparagine synthase (glutamine-hydrolyzing) [Pectinatus frisingensis]